MNKTITENNPNRRCAIYTRKSHEEGLEQNFNSLDAQREACEAFIISQKHEGWKMLPDYYDDGGISGATMERPALKQLLTDVAAGRVDAIIVYKVDRLTRSLSDFAKIVDVLDKYGSSFVSVTQQFNTTSSMGRLTLNVLLSFAQFEREVTAERIRDKIAASKKKGMWMGGNVPLGYDCVDKKLVVNETEATTVRYIYQRYAELGSVASLREVLKEAGIVSKIRVNKAGRQSGGGIFYRGALYHLLQNRLYLGDIVHKDLNYPGNHQAIVDQELWDQVQARLANNRIECQSGKSAKEPSLLAGLIFDDLGIRMTPSHAVKKGKRYRYYVSRSLINGPRADAPRGRRTPAGEIEQLVTKRICQMFQDEALILDTVTTHTNDLAEQKWLMANISDMAFKWPNKTPTEIRQLLLALIVRIDILTERVDIQIRPSALVQIACEKNLTPLVTKGPTITMSVVAKLKRTGMETKMIIEGARLKQKPDRSLVRLLVQAERYQYCSLKSRDKTISQLAEDEKVSRSYFVRILRLSYLAPDIVRAILTGTQPPELTAKKLAASSRLPLTWPEQRDLLRFI
jgi:site-specific DNA recombinase